MVERWGILKNKIKPAVPFLFLYDYAGGQAISSGGTYLTWDRVKIKTSEFTYNADEDKVVINNNATGLYEIIFECSYHVVTNLDATDLKAEVVINGIAKEGADSWTHIGEPTESSPSNQKGCQSIHFYEYLVQGDEIQIKITADNDNKAETEWDSSRLIIKFIPVRGWNNDAGGKWSEKGGVLR